MEDHGAVAAPGEAKRGALGKLAVLGIGGDRPDRRARIDRHRLGGGFGHGARTGCGSSLFEANATLEKRPATLACAHGIANMHPSCTGRTNHPNDFLNLVLCPLSSVLCPLSSVLCPLSSVL